MSETTANIHAEIAEIQDHKNLIHRIEMGGEGEVAYYVEGSEKYQSLIVTGDRVFGVAQLDIAPGSRETKATYMSKPEVIHAVLKDQQFRAEAKASGGGFDALTHINVPELPSASCVITPYEPGAIDLAQHLKNVASDMTPIRTNPFKTVSAN